MSYEQVVRGEIAVERIERIADACSRASARRRSRRRAWWQLPWLVGLQRAARAHRSAAKPELQG
jgi:hypothetical protein